MFHSGFTVAESTSWWFMVVLSLPVSQDLQDLAMQLEPAKVQEWLQNNRQLDQPSAAQRVGDRTAAADSSVSSIQQELDRASQFPSKSSPLETQPVNCCTCCCWSFSGGELLHVLWLLHVL